MQGPNYDQWVSKKFSTSSLDEDAPQTNQKQKPSKWI